MTAGPSLSVQRLQVRRTPGIPDPFQLADLCPGINIVHGPNGSGKSSTLRAIEAILWRDRPVDSRLHLAADYTLDGVRYVVEVDSGRRNTQRDGVPHDEPAFPAPDLYHRYRLSLQDLLAAGDSGDEFAREIGRQSAGGYDIDAATRKLGFESSPSTPRALHAELRQARDVLAEAQQAQQRLHAEAAGLAQLEARAEEARAASARVRELECALRHARARDELHVARTARETFPPGLEKLRGDEAERASQLGEQVAVVESRERDAARELQAAEQELASSIFAEEPPPDLIPALTARLEHARELHQKVVEGELRVSDAERVLASVRQQIGSAVPDEKLESIDTGGVAELATFARRIEAQDAALAAASAELRQAGEASEAPANVETLRRGADLLTQWLRDSGTTDTRSSDRWRPLILLWLAAAIAVAGWLALAFTWHPAAGLMILLVLVLTFLGSRQPSRVDTAAMRQRDFERLGLENPAEWSPRDVTATLDSLSQRIAAARLAEQREAWRTSVELRIAELRKEREGTDRDAADLVGRFGVAPDTDVRLLSWLTERIAAWQGSRAALFGATGALAKARELATQAVLEIAQRVSPFWRETPRSLADAVGVVDAMSDALAARRETQRVREGAARDVEHARADLSRLRAELAALYEGAGIDPADPAALATLCDRVPLYRAAREAEESASGELNRAGSELAQFGDRAVALADADVSTLMNELDAASSLAAEVSDRAAAVAALRTRLDQAGRQDEVERSLDAVARAEAALEAHRNRELARVIGGTLVHHLKRATRDRHRPAVFHKARELFSIITNGRYRLDFGQEGQPETFRALDNTTGRGHSLDELSSGSRVQLLLAVRVAFVETQEQGHRLPLFLDEVLGTSDDERAKAVIEAVIRLSASRQVFYFTAQRDEVAKWRSALQESGVEHAIVDLAQVRGLPSVPHAAWDLDPLPEELLRPVAEPGTHSHASYGEILRPPPLRLDAGAGAAHLWYLVHDTEALYALLSRGIRTWGQYRSLIENGAPILPAAHREVCDRAAALGRALHVLCEQAAIGRGRPVDREVLVRSGAVSDTMLDRVHEAAQQCSGNAIALIDALERGDVPRFLRARTDELREFLRAEGYLDDRPRLSSERIRHAMAAAVAPELEARTLGLGELNELMEWASG